MEIKNPVKGHIYIIKSWIKNLPGGNIMARRCLLFTFERMQTLDLALVHILATDYLPSNAIRNSCLELVAVVDFEEVPKEELPLYLGMPHIFPKFMEPLNDI